MGSKLKQGKAMQRRPGMTRQGLGQECSNEVDNLHEKSAPINQSLLSVFGNMLMLARRHGVKEDDVQWQRNGKSNQGTGRAKHRRVLKVRNGQKHRESINQNTLLS